MNNIKKLRENSKLSQRKLAKEIKVHHSTISMLESGERKGNIITLKKIAKYFNTSIDELCPK